MILGEVLQQRPPVRQLLVEPAPGIELRHPSAPRGVLEPRLPQRPDVAEHVEIDRDGGRRLHASMLDSRGKRASGKGTRCESGTVPPL